MANVRLIASSALLAWAGLAASLHGAVVVKPGGSTTLAALSNGITKAEKNPAEIRVVNLSGDQIADTADVARAARGEKVIYALGPDAVTAASEANTAARIVALSVPNPARLGVKATYLSIYPPHVQTVAFLRSKLNAATVGFLYTPTENREVAADFTAAATAGGVKVVPIAVSSPGELSRGVRDAVPRIDALVLAVDPFLFDKMNLRFVVETCSAARKPTVAFLPELVTMGISITMSVDPQALVQAAVKQGAAPVGPLQVIHIDQTNINVSPRWTQQSGVSLESLGAKKNP